MADAVDHTPAPPAPEPRSPWSTGKKLAAAVLATAGAITGLWGAAKAIDEIPDKWEEWRTPTSEMDRTPSLGLQVLQSGKERPLLRTDEDEIVKVDVRRAPLQLVVPGVDGETAVQIMASTSPSAGDVEPGSPLESIPFFSGGTGMADYEYSSGQLVLAEDAHMYLVGQRLRAHEGGVSAFFGTIGDAGTATPLPLSEQREDVHLVVLVNKNGDDVADFGELEHLHLDFSG